MLATDSLPPIAWWDIVLRLGIALFVGALVSLNQDFREKSVGLRSNMLVSLGSAFLVLVALQLGIIQSEPELLSSVIEGIITGVGVIGAGILVSTLRRSRAVKIEGFTSALSIWLSSGLGMAIGCGLWQLAWVGVVLYWLIFRVVKQPKKT